jgi:hypothetical protein
LFAFRFGACRNIHQKPDTAYDKIYKINRDAAMRGIVEAFAADTTKSGCWWARAILHQVDGKDMHFMFKAIDPSSERTANTEEAATALSDTAEPTAGFVIYPNPAGSSYKLRYNSDMQGNCIVSMRDILGKLISSSTIEPNTVYEYSTGGLNQGIYFVTLIQDNRPAGTQKLLIMK